MSVWDEHKAAVVAQLAGLQIARSKASRAATNPTADVESRRSATVVTDQLDSEIRPLRAALDAMNGHEQRAAAGEPM